MATTLTIALFRNNEINIGHVGDCRSFLVQGGIISQVTSDHNYAAQQLALGLISARDAATSDMRCMLTRSIGRELTVQVDYHTVQVQRSDILVQCSDGLHYCVTEQEILDFVTKKPPTEACRELIQLAERRGTDDNLSVHLPMLRCLCTMLSYGHPHLAPSEYQHRSWSNMRWY
jgi:protein phosphatase